MPVYNTPLIRMTQLDLNYSGTVYIKDESVQKTGTFKDRRCYEQCLNVRDGDCIGTITSGNSGRSLEYFKPDNIIIYSFVFPGMCLDLGRKPNCHRIELNLSERRYFESDLVKLIDVDPNNFCLCENRTAFVFSGDKEYHQKNVSSLAYKRLLDEIAEELEDFICFCPVGGGELFYALELTARDYRHKGRKIDIVGCSIESNPFSRVILNKGSQIRYRKVSDIAENPFEVKIRGLREDNIFIRPNLFPSGFNTPKLCFDRGGHGICLRIV